MLQSIMSSQLGLVLLVLSVFIVIALLIEFIPKFKKNKKLKIMVAISFLVISVLIFIPYAIILNPKVEATMKDTYVQFKTDEKASFDSIDKIEYFDNVDKEISPNGFRWGNDDYYSGDADIKMFEKGNEEELLYLHKAKVYIDKDVDAYIVITRNTPSKTFVFNYSTKEKTKEVFQQLEEKCSQDK